MKTLIGFVLLLNVGIAKAEVNCNPGWASYMCENTCISASEDCDAVRFDPSLPGTFQESSVLPDPMWSYVDPTLKSKDDEQARRLCRPLTAIRTSEYTEEQSGDSELFSKNRFLTISAKYRCGEAKSAQSSVRPTTNDL